MGARLKIRTWIDKENVKMELLIDKFGFYGLLIFYLLDKIYPQWSGFFLSARTKKQDSDLERLREEQRSERDSREIDRVFRREVDERHIKAFENLVSTSQQQAQLLVSLAERMNQLNTNQMALTTFLTESLASVRKKVAIDKK